MELPDCRLIHYGKREVLSRIEAMEEEYDEPLAYVDPGPAVPGAAPTADPSMPWGEGITVCGPAQLLKGRLTPSLMADSYGSRGEEEWAHMQGYLKAHGGWQLEQVGVTSESDWSLTIRFGRLLYEFAGHLYNGRTS